MLDRPREPDRHIDLRGDNFPGLPDLEFIREPAGINDRPGRAQGRAKNIRQPLAQRNTLIRPPGPPANGNDDVSLLEIRAIRAGRLQPDEDLAWTRQAGRRIDGLYRGALASRGWRRKLPRAALGTSRSAARRGKYSLVAELVAAAVRRYGWPERKAAAAAAKASAV